MEAHIRAGNTIVIFAVVILILPELDCFCNEVVLLWDWQTLIDAWCFNKLYNIRYIQVAVTKFCCTNYLLLCVRQNFVLIFLKTHVIEKS